MRELWSRIWSACVALYRRHPRVVPAAGGGVVAVVAGSIAAAVLLTSAPPPPPPPAPPRPVARDQPVVVRAPAPPPRPRGPLTSPFTGERIARLARVLAVKIDNIVFARPQTGLASADIVYVLPVEGGLSRYLAVFSSHVPKVIGPVRSAREDDLNVLRQFGMPAFAFSGAAPHLLPFVERARVVDLYAGLPSVAPAYYRDGGRPAPYNLFAESSVLLARSHRASVARDIGFRFGPVPAGARGRAVGTVSAGYSAAQFSFHWSGRAGKWLVSVDGSPATVTGGGQLGAPTIIIQHTLIRTSRFLEYGKLPPYAQSLGHGTAQVLRNGRSYTVRWSRSSADHGTVYTLPDGKRMTFSRGQVWVILVS